MSNPNSTGPLEAAQHICTEGIELSGAGKHNEALDRYTFVIEQFGERIHPDFLRVIATAMFNAGTSLANLGRNEEAVTAYDALIKRFNRRANLFFVIYVVKAMMNKAYRLNTLLRNEEAVTTYVTVVARFGAIKDPTIQALVDSVKAFLTERQAVLNAREQATGAKRSQT